VRPARLENNFPGNLCVRKGRKIILEPYFAQRRPFPRRGSFSEGAGRLQISDSSLVFLAGIAYTCSIEHMRYFRQLFAYFLAGTSDHERHRPAVISAADIWSLDNN
jgi:hypothetical protein